MQDVVPDEGSLQLPEVGAHEEHIGVTFAARLPEVQQDRERAEAVQELAIPVVCSKVQKGTTSGREVARV